MNVEYNAPRLFTNQLLDHSGQPTGVHLGCDDIEVCKQSHVDGKISPIIHEWVDAGEAHRLHAENALLDAERNDLARQLNESNERNGRLIAQRDELLEALMAMLLRDERNTCRHEETHRGGVIWEICDSCGAMWADDQGGKPEWEDPKEWTQARAAIKAAEEGKL